mmetsp:Transcript_12391/g.26985  ORF Transcript_12391/g.26985 Transcript_12391/m.26985 type:complete len:677 (+) Transcript_12391:166-2196(+)
MPHLGCESSGAAWQWSTRPERPTRSLPRGLVVGHEPVHRPPDAILDGGELVVRPQTAQLLVAGGLLVLTVGLGGVAHQLALEVHRLRDQLRHLLDGHLCRLVHAEDDGLDGIVRTQSPHGELGQVHGVDELPERGARTPDHEVRAVALGDVALVDEAGDHMAIADGEVVVGAVDVRGDDRGVLQAILVLVAVVEHVDHPLRVRVARVRVVGRAVVHHRLIDGVGRLVREDARGEARDALLHTVDAAALQDIVVDQGVVAVEVHLLPQVVEEATDLRREVDHVRRLVLHEDLVHGSALDEVAVLAREEDPVLLGGLGIPPDDLLDRLAVEAGAAGHQDGDLLLEEVHPAHVLGRQGRLGRINLLADRLRGGPQLQSDRFHVAVEHLVHELLEARLGLPPELLHRQGRVAEQRLDLGGAEVPRRDLDEDSASLLVDGLLLEALAAPEHRPADHLEADRDELAHAVLLVRRHDVVVGLLLLQHEPHGLDVVTRVAPVAERVHVAKLDPLLLAGLDLGHGHRHLLRHEGAAAPGGLVVEEDAVHRVHVVRLSVVLDDPEAVELRHRVRGARVEGGRLLLRNLLHKAVQLGGRRLVEASRLLEADRADRLEDSQGAHAVGLCSVLGLLERDLHMGLRGQVVHLVGSHLGHDRRQVRAVHHVAIVQLHFVEDVVYPCGVEGG